MSLTKPPPAKRGTFPVLFIFSKKGTPNLSAERALITNSPLLRKAGIESVFGPPAPLMRPPACLSWNAPAAPSFIAVVTDPASNPNVPVPYSIIVP